VRDAITFPLAKKVVLVTGAGGGLGSSLAEVLVERGAKVALIDIDEAAADRAAAALPDSQAFAAHGDVTDLDSMRAAVALTIERFGRLDVAIANAGILGRAATLRTTSPADLEAVMRVNVSGAVNTVAAAIEPVIANRGQMAVVSSVYAFINGAGAVPYAMSKAAVAQLGHGLNVELAPYGASAMTAYFSLIETDLIRQGIDAHPNAVAVLNTAPSFLLARIPPRTAACGLADGLERRAQQILMPRRWRRLASLQGVVVPAVERRNVRDTTVHSALIDLEHHDAERQGLRSLTGITSRTSPQTPHRERGTSMDATSALSARLSNLVARRAPNLGKKTTARQVEQFRSSGGRKGNTIVGRPVFLLDVVGRSSGELRPVMLMHVPRGDDLIVVGSAAGADTTPNWYRNLMAAGGGEVQVGSERWKVTARELPAGPELDECWSLATTAYPGFGAYQTFTDRRIPVALLEPVSGHAEGPVKGPTTRGTT
jgi:deazaflavin-dependent oxidoreductase (nitroreductase family)